MYSVVTHSISHRLLHRSNCNSRGLSQKPSSDCHLRKMSPSAKPISSPVPEAWYPMLTVLMLSIGLIVTAAFFIYEATSSKKNRSLAKELTTGAVASVFLGFGSLFLLLSSGVYV